MSGTVADGGAAPSADDTVMLDAPAAVASASATHADERATMRGDATVALKRARSPAAATSASVAAADAAVADDCGDAGGDACAADAAALSHANAEKPAKRARRVATASEDAYDWTLKESLGHSRTLEQCFRELLANAYDEHVLAQQDPRSVVVEAPRQASGDTTRALIWNKHGVLSLDSFSMEQSRKSNFRMRKDVFASCVGFFGTGLSHTASALLGRGFELVYETADVVIVLSTLRGAQHEQRCAAAARKAVADLHVQLNLDQGFDANLKSADAADAGAAAGSAGCKPQQHPVRARTFTFLRDSQHESVEGGSTEGTRLHVLFPHSLPSDAIPAWQHAQQSFLHAHSTARPLFSVTVSQWPALQVLPKVAVPAQLFAEHPNAADADDRELGDFIFINGLAYRVPKVKLHFTWSFFIDTRKRKANPDVLVAMERMREALADTRKQMEWRPCSNIIDTLLANVPSKLSDALTTRMVVSKLAALEAKREFPQYKAELPALEKDLADSLTKPIYVSSKQCARTLMLDASFVTMIRDSLSVASSTHDDLTRAAVNTMLSQLFAVHSHYKDLRKKDGDAMLAALAQHGLATANEEVSARVARQDAAESDAADGSDDEHESDVEEDERKCNASRDESPREAGSSAEESSHASREHEPPDVAQATLSEARAVVERLGDAGSLAQMELLDKQLAESAPDKRAELVATATQQLQQVVAVSRALQVFDADSTVRMVVYKQGAAQPLVDKVMQRAKKFAPQLTWDTASHVTEPFSAANFHLHGVPLDVLQLLLGEESAGGDDLPSAAFQQFILDVQDSTMRPGDVTARRALLFIMRKLLVQCGKAHVGVRITRDAVPSLQLENDVPVLHMPWCDTEARSSGPTILPLERSTLLECLRLAAEADLRDVSPDVESASFVAAQAMLLQSLAPQLSLAHNNAAFVVQLQSSTPLDYHIVVLIDAWGRRFGGVPAFNMLLCHALIKCRWSNAGNNTASPRNVRVTCVVGNGELPALAAAAADTRLRFLAAPSVGAGVADPIARLTLVSGATLREAQWPAHVDLVMGHDRFSGHAANVVAARLQAMSLVFAHTDPPAIAATKSDAYGGQEKDELLSAVLRNTDQPVACGATHDNVAGLQFKYMSPDLSPLLRFNAGYIAPSEAYRNLLWQPPQLEGGTDAVGVAIVGRLEDELKNVAHFQKVVKQLTSTDNAYTSTYIGISPHSANKPHQSVNATSAQRLRWYTSSEQRLLEDLRTCLCLLMPSLVESYGLVAAEALGIGMPIIVSKRSGIGQRLLYLADHLDAWAHQPQQGDASGDWDVKTRFRKLVKHVVVAVSTAGDDDAIEQDVVQAWADSVKWIRENTENKLMPRYVQLLRMALGSWQDSVQKQLCDKIVTLKPFVHHRAHIDRLQRTHSWI